MTTQSLLSRADLLFAGALFATVLLLIVPVPPILLDGLLAISIGIWRASTAAPSAWGSACPWRTFVRP